MKSISLIFTENAQNRRFSIVWPCKYRFDSDKIFRIILSQWELQADKKIKSTTHLLQLCTYYMFRHYQNDYETLACDCLLRNALQLLLLSNQRPKLLLLHVARGGVWFEIHDNNWGVQIHLDPQKLRSFKKNSSTTEIQPSLLLSANPWNEMFGLPPPPLLSFFNQQNSFKIQYVNNEELRQSCWGSHSKFKIKNYHHWDQLNKKSGNRRGWLTQFFLYTNSLDVTLWSFSAKKL